VLNSQALQQHLSSLYLALAGGDRC